MTINEQIRMITIDRYFDRIVMSNPGTMLISMEEYLECGHSVCRNPVLQKMFIFLGVGEKGGSGADIISKGWKDNGWAVPTLQEKSSPDRVETVLLVDQGGLQGGLSTIEGGLQGGLSSIESGLSETVRKILTLMRENPAITYDELANTLGKARSGIAKHIKKLKENGLLPSIE